MWRERDAVSSPGTTGETARTGPDSGDPRSRVQASQMRSPGQNGRGRQSPAPKTEERVRKALNREQGSGLCPRRERKLKGLRAHSEGESDGVGRGAGLWDQRGSGTWGPNSTLGYSPQENTVSGCFETLGHQPGWWKRWRLGQRALLTRESPTPAGLQGGEAETQMPALGAEGSGEAKTPPPQATE